MRTFTHTLLARILTFLLITLPIAAPILKSRELAHQPHRSPQSSGQPDFRVVIDSVTEPQPQIILTNLSEVPLTACFMNISIWSEARRQGVTLWDAFLLNKPPIAKEANVSMPLGHIVGQPYPDKVEVAAAVWADGTTYGDADLLKHILRGRASRAQALNQIVLLLQTGLEQEWTRDQFLAALDKMPDVLTREAFGVRSTLKVNTNIDANPKIRKNLIQTFIDRLSPERDALRQSKPDFTAPYIPN
jgi:hypothetical protein